MRLKPLISGDEYPWKICAPLNSQNQTELELFLNELDGNFHANRDGMLLVMQRYAQLGPSAMTDSICHLANKEEKIWEFIKGRIRIYWFDAGDKIIVCVCACIKKTNKVEKTLIEQAIRIKDEYFRQGNVEIIEQGS